MSKTAFALWRPHCPLLDRPNETSERCYRQMPYSIHRAFPATQMTRIYVTHCSHKKDEHYKETGEAIFPDLLYTARPTQKFMTRCKEGGVRWAIFSDLYGVWLPQVRHEWYEKDPNKVSKAEFLALVRDFDEKLASYSEICFYYNPGRFHRLYARLLDRSVLAGRVKRITHLRDIA